MPDRNTREVILRLAREGHRVRQIARALGISYHTTRGVLTRDASEVKPCAPHPKYPENLENLEKEMEEENARQEYP